MELVALKGVVYARQTKALMKVSSARFPIHLIMALSTRFSVLPQMGIFVACSAVLGSHFWKQVLIDRIERLCLKLFARSCVATLAL